MSTIDRKEFLKKSGMYVGGLMMANHISPGKSKPVREPFCVDQIGVRFEIEPLKHPFGFKGGSLNELWQIATQMKSSNGKNFVGLSVESPLWADATVTHKWGIKGGNVLMYCMSEKAKLVVKEQKYSSPIGMTNKIFHEVYDYGKRITENNNLSPNFALNAITSFDFSAWLMYAEQNGIRSFDALIPPEYRKDFSHRHKKITNLPLISYDTTISDMKLLAQKGYFLFKIKIGAAGNNSTMMRKDMERIKLIHKTIGHIKSAYTETGTVNYTFDANGRYKKEDLVKFLDYCGEIGARDQIVLIEEPFSDSTMDVSEFDVIIAADESVHSAESAKKLSRLGYRAFALKPTPKTLSRTFEIGKVAHKNNIALYVADLTVNPALVEWNKNVAARIPPLPGLKTAVMESNGRQNYTHWKTMKKYLPLENASWDKEKNGFFALNNERCSLE
jgi:hypothetical protein